MQFSQKSLNEMAEQIIEILSASKLTLMAAESATGGMLSHTITNVTGASKVFLGGIVCYTAEIKNSLLKVPWQIINDYGTVSAETTEYLLKGLEEFGADLLISITGVAGSRLEGHPTGLVFIGVKHKENLKIKEYHFKGKREEIKFQAVKNALEMVLNIIEKGIDEE